MFRHDFDALVLYIISCVQCIILSKYNCVEFKSAVILLPYNPIILKVMVYQ